jgi:hypothetical protein
MEKIFTIEQLVEFLYFAHGFNILNKRIVDGLSQSFDIDVNELCLKHGITYFLK